LETNVQHMENYVENKPDLDESYEEKLSVWSIGVLTSAAVTVKAKFDREKSSNQDRQRWGSLLVSLIHEVGIQVSLKRKLDELETRIAKLEELRGLKY
jgi:hypothetical protein